MNSSIDQSQVNQIAQMVVESPALRELSHPKDTGTSTDPVASQVPPEGQKMNIDGMYGQPDETNFMYDTIDNLNAARSTKEPPLDPLKKEDIEKLNTPPAPEPVAEGAAQGADSAAQVADSAANDAAQGAEGAADTTGAGAASGGPSPAATSGGRRRTKRKNGKKSHKKGKSSKKVAKRRKSRKSSSRRRRSSRK